MSQERTLRFYRDQTLPGTVHPFQGQPEGCTLVELHKGDNEAVWRAEIIALLTFGWVLETEVTDGAQQFRLQEEVPEGNKAMLSQLGYMRSFLSD